MYADCADLTDIAEFHPSSFVLESSVVGRPLSFVIRPSKVESPRHIPPSGASMPSQRETYPVEIHGVKRALPLFEVKPGLKIAVLNILGDTELVEAAATGLSAKLDAINYDLLVTAEAKSIPLVHALSVRTHKPYVVLRKSYKPYMGEVIQAETLSITTGAPQTLFLDEKDHELVNGKRVVLVDDVISTGSTLQGMRLVLQKAGARVVAESAIFTEGERAQWENIVALGHLPVFTG
jgi:adenine phosphoribosyltransferase